MDEQQPVSDDQRRAVVERLTEQVGTGRLDLTEFDDRAREAWAATSQLELAQVAADLPVPTPELPPADGDEVRAWAGVGVVNLLVWLAVSLGVGEAIYFWPVWVIGPWGLVLASRATWVRSRGTVLAPRLCRAGPGRVTATSSS